MDDTDEVSELADKVVHENISVHDLEEISKNAEIKKRLSLIHI